MRGRHGGNRSRTAAFVAGLLLLGGLVAASSGGAAHAEDGAARLYLVTLTGPGTTGHRGTTPRGEIAARMLAEQRRLLDTVGVEHAAYQWTTALNGFAAELTPAQVATLTADDAVAYAEANAVRPLAELGTAVPRRAVATTSSRRTSDGGGIVIGFVDTGIAPSGPAFSRTADLGPTPVRFRGRCADAPDDPSWNASDCTAKVVGARAFVTGFGADRLRTSEALSPRDTSGHGTATASIAAGTADVPVRAGRHRLGRFSGVAPRSRVAAYKACWAAPDPDDDGCATADLVAAIDQATSDRVDVLNLSVGGPASQIDTVERALLGAVEAGIVVTAAAGNGGAASYAAHPSPWVVTVGATVTAERVGAVVTPGGPRLSGAMAASAPVGPAPLVLATDAVSAGAGRAQARVCAPGSLDPRRVSGAIVVCHRGGTARVDKSTTVRLADGVGMVLLNDRPGSTDADLHSVPTVHLAAPDGARLLRWAARHPRTEVRLVSGGITREPARVAAFSGGGDPTWSVVKPDLVAPGTEELAATPTGWDLVTGTSAATAHVSGVAATLLGKPGVTAAEVRSALVTQAMPIRGRVGLRAGAGQVRDTGVPALAFLIGRADYRGWLTGRRSDLDLPHAVLGSGRATARRTLTNTGRRALWIVPRLEGLAGAARVSPSGALLRPGRSATFTITRVTGAGTGHGAVVWRSARGDEARLSVVLSR